MWCMGNGNCLETISACSFVSSVEFSKDGKVLLTKEGEDIMGLRHVVNPGHLS
jgi:hypothetical protein